MGVSLNRPHRGGSLAELSADWRMILFGTVATLAVVAVALWFALPDRTLREAWNLYADPAMLSDILRGFGPFAPAVFIVIQALQVVVAPIPGDITGLLGGFVFGEAVGFLYSTIGLTAGSLAAFWAGRRLGRPFVERTVGAAGWAKIGFLVETEGAILCFVIYLLPGLPKDLVCYLFGLSPMSFGVFALASTLGRMPGTWVLSAQGAKVATVTALALLRFAVASAAEALSPTAVLRTEYRDGAALTVIGTVVNARIWTTPSGIRYSRFHLSDGRVGLPTIFAGPTRCPDGGTATVIGFYRPARVVEGRLFQQHLEARTIHCEETAERIRER